MPEFLNLVPVETFPRWHTGGDAFHVRRQRVVCQIWRGRTVATEPVVEHSPRKVSDAPHLKKIKQQLCVQRNAEQTQITIGVSFQASSTVSILYIISMCQQPEGREKSSSFLYNFEVLVLHFSVFPNHATRYVYIFLTSTSVKMQILYLLLCTITTYFAN